MKIDKMKIIFAFLFVGIILFLLSGLAIMIFPGPFCQYLSVFIPLSISVMGFLIGAVTSYYFFKKGYEKETRNLYIWALFVIQFFGFASSYKYGGQWNTIIRIIIPIPILAPIIYYAI